MGKKTFVKCNYEGLISFSVQYLTFTALAYLRLKESLGFAVCYKHTLSATGLVQDGVTEFCGSLGGACRTQGFYRTLPEKIHVASL